MEARVREISVLAGVLLAFVAIFALQTGASGQPAAETGERVAGEPVDTADGETFVAGGLIVTYEEGASEATEEEAVEDVDGVVEDEIEALDAEVIEIPAIQDDAPGETREQKLEDAREDLENEPGVAAVDYDYIRRPTADPDTGFEPEDPYYYEQWGLDKPNFPAAWQPGLGNYGTDADVAVIDSGIAQDHEDFNYGTSGGPLESRVFRQRDFVNDDLIAQDEDGHGTHVAGTVAAATNNQDEDGDPLTPDPFVGVAGGCPDCDLFIAKALTGAGGTDSDISEAIVWATDHGVDVINMSLGAPGSSTVLREAVDYAYARNVVVVAAAGNSNSSVVNYPAGYPNAISVVATNSRDRRASFSNYGGTVDVAAPGVGILSTVPGSGIEGGYKFFDGTSMASPHVAALAALLVAQDEADLDPDDRTNTEIRGLIQRHAKDLGAQGRDQYYGSGRINALKSLRRGQ